jgi:outer membrane protein TolC
VKVLAQEQCVISPRLSQHLLAAGLFCLSGLLATQAQALTLEQALERAMAQHPQLQAVQAQVAAARARVDVAGAPLLPTASLDVSHSEQTANFAPRPGFIPRNLNTSGSSSSQSAEIFPFWQATAQSRWTVTDFGRTKAQVRSTDRAADAAEADVVAARNQLALAVATSYLQVLAAEQVVAQLRDARDLAQLRRDAAQRKVEASVRPQLDLHKAQADVAEAEVAVLRGEESVRSARVALGVAMGDRTGGGPEDALQWPTMPASAAGGPAATTETAAMVDAAAARRPEFAALQARIAAVQADVSAQERAHRPSLYVGAQASLAGIEVSGLAWNVALTGGVNLPFTPLWTQAPLLAATRAQIRALQAQRDLQLLAVRSDIEQARLALAQAQKRLPAVAVLVDYADKAKTAATQRYQAGVASAIEVSNAESQWNQAKLQQTQAQVEVLLAQARLAFAQGLL